METIELFGVGEVMPSLDERVAQASAAITRLFRANHPVFCAYSGGKDSSVTVNLVLNAARDWVAAGGSAVVVVTTSDTLVENPEVAEHFRREMSKIASYAKQHGVKITTRIVQPNLASTFQMKILTGRGLPSFAGTSSDCSSDLKVTPQQAFRSKSFSALRASGCAEPVTCVGTRYSESERRAMNMLARGDRADEPARNRDGDLVLCPVAFWSDDDIWEYIGMCASGIWPSYSDFAEMKRIYAASMGTSCAVVADALIEGGKKQRTGRCGARHGCWSCLQAEDRSLQNMIEFDERYAYARGLNRLNKFLRATRYDWSLRHWVGKTIRGGYIVIQPDTYHPKMVRALFRMMLQLDKDEQERAALAGERPRFEILPERMIVAIDAMQSLNGVARPFQCWDDWRAVHLRGVRFDVPEVPATPPQELPDARFLYVGEQWQSGSSSPSWAGLRDPLIEHLTEGGGCAKTLREARNGAACWRVETGPVFDVDEESAAMLVDFELDRMLAEYDRGMPPGGVTAGYKFYLGYGALQLSHAQNLEHDAVCRRTEFKDRLGLTLDYRIDRLLAQSVAFSDMPDASRRAWIAKATDLTAQKGFWPSSESAAPEYA